MLTEFFEWRSAATTFDSTGNALRQQQPPRDDVPIPCVDNHIHVLIKQVAFDDGDVRIVVRHGSHFATIETHKRVL